MSFVFLVVPLLILLLAALIQFWAIGLMGSVGKGRSWLLMLAGALLQWLSLVTVVGGIVLEGSRGLGQGGSGSVMEPAFWAALTGVVLFSAGFAGSCRHYRALNLRMLELEQQAARSVVELEQERARHPVV